MNSTPQSAAFLSFNFASPVEIPGVAGVDAEAPQVTRAGDDVLILAHEFVPNPAGGSLQPDIFLFRSTDRGATFRPRINLSNTPTDFSGFERIAVSRIGNQTRVYVTWIEGVGKVNFRRDRTNDGSFANVKQLNGSLGGNAVLESLRIAASGDNVFVVWQAPQPPNDDPDIFVASSKDSGDTFKVVNLSNNALTISDAPSVAVLSNGRGIVAWRDNSGGDFRIFYALGQ